MPRWTCASPANQPGGSGPGADCAKAGGASALVRKQSKKPAMASALRAIRNLVKVDPRPIFHLPFRQSSAATQLLPGAAQRQLRSVAPGRNPPPARPPHVAKLPGSKRALLGRSDRAGAAKQAIVAEPVRRPLYARFEIMHAFHCSERNGLRRSRAHASAREFAKEGTRLVVTNLNPPGARPGWHDAHLGARPSVWRSRNPTAWALPRECQLCATVCTLAITIGKQLSIRASKVRFFYYLKRLK